MDRPKFDIIPVTEWKAPEKIEGLDPHIITMPNVPKPIQGPGCQPRTILKGTWDHMRRKCYFDAGYKCEACGAEVGKDIDKRNLHCLEKGTDVLTAGGWKPVEQVNGLDRVAQFDPQNEEISFATPTNFYQGHADKIYKIGYKKGFSMGVSGNHRVLIKKMPKGDWETVLAKDLEVGTWSKIPAAGKGAGSAALSFDERLMIALQADGSCQGRLQSGEYVFNIRVKKDRKVERLNWLINNCTFRHTRISDRDYTGYLVWVDKDCKKLSNCFSWSMSYDKATDFLDELVKWDGWEGSRTNSSGGKVAGRCYYSSEKENIDFVQAIATQAGFGTHVTVTHRKTRNWSKWHIKQDISTDLKPAYNLEIKKTNSYGLNTMKKELVEYDDDVFCFSVPTHYFVARTKGGDPFITGNSHELFDYDFVNGVATFKRCVALCEKDHVRGVHSGRMYTMYKKGNPFMTKSMVLEGAEHAFSLIHKWNVEHPDEEPLRLYATWIEFAKDKVIGEEICALIDKYDVKFYGIDGKKQAQWGDWKVVIGNKEYPTPYQDEQAWAEKMEELNHTQTTDSRNYKDPFTGGVFDEIKKVLKNP